VEPAGPMFSCLPEKKTQPLNGSNSFNSGSNNTDVQWIIVYTDIHRRAVDIHERQFLQDSKAVTEMQCDLGKCTTIVHRDQ